MKNLPLIFCAIDTPELDRAVRLASIVGPVVGGIKLGLEFFNSNGPQGVERVLRATPDTKLFLDLKFHDIPNTVAGAVRSINYHFSPAFLNVHAAGGLEMMQAAKAECSQDTKLLAVTVLTSLNAEDLIQTGVSSDATGQVAKLTELTIKANLDGVVCSSHEIRFLRESFPPSLLLMVPGIRPEGTDVQDQKRVMTPKRAIELGANHLVIGRPITSASDPIFAAKAVLESLKS